DGSGFVTSIGSLAARGGTRYSPPGSVNRIVPPRPHVPTDDMDLTWQIVWGDPPSRSILFNWPLSKNAIARLSGDQNGLYASSVAGSGSGSGESRRRTKS